MRLLYVLLSLICIQVAYAQPSLKKMMLATKGAVQQNDIAPTFEMSLITPSQAAVFFAKNTPAPSLFELNTWLHVRLGLRNNIDNLVQLAPDTKTADNIDFRKLQQFYKGIKVEHGVITTAAKQGVAGIIGMEFYSIPDEFNTSPNVSENDALSLAISHLKTRFFDFTDSAGNTIESRKPKGELVIIKNYKNDSSICLSYKFKLKAMHIFWNGYIYVNAWDGSIVLENNLVRKANMDGKADTRYSGRVDIVTDDQSGIPGKKFRLFQTRNGHEISVKNYNNRPSGHPYKHYESEATEFVDDDNIWQASEYNNANKDNVALDVIFNMQVISDYWSTVHGRNSWDGNKSPMKNYVHVKKAIYEPGSNGKEVYIGDRFMDNAFWNGEGMYFGDGPNGEHPFTTLDISAHELGHAITQTTSGLIYRWESGALDEGFSDIWAACVINWFKVHNNTAGASKKTWLRGADIVLPGESKEGFRNMAKPTDYEHPDTYKAINKFWIDQSNYQQCPVEDDDLNDHCGVHTNSGVLNKWFYLITEGEYFTNAAGEEHYITGLGFGITQKIAFLTSSLLTPNSGYAVARTVSLNATEYLYGISSIEAITVEEAWDAVKVKSNIYNTDNAPIFATNSFSSVAVSKNGYVWAGTNFNGLYMFDGTNWSVRNEINNVRINSIQADRSGGVWVAQSGVQTNVAQAIGGGVNYFPTPTDPMKFYTNSLTSQTPSRNGRCIYIDTFLLNDGTNPRVWVAMGTFQRTADLISQSGMLAQGLYNTYREFQPVSMGIDVNNKTRSCLSVGGKKGEVWTFVQANAGINQLLQYDAVTQTLIGFYDATNTPTIPSGFYVRSIYFDAKGRGWFGLATGNLLVYDEYKVWHHINTSSFMPAGSSCNFNSIAGDKWGDVYIGTNVGMLMFDHDIGQNELIDDLGLYHFYNEYNGFPSSNINAIAYDTLRYKLWLATDKGIAHWEPPCYSKSCYTFSEKPKRSIASTKAGNWSDNAIWSDSQLPDSLTEVIISHPIIVDINASSMSLTVTPPGSIRVNAGVHLDIYQTKRNVKTGLRKRRTVLPNL
jgi:Zn-dependent metalloprotease